MCIFAFHLFTERTASTPSQLSSISVEESQTSGSGAAVNISWKLLPCLRQNGADIIDYVVQYNPTSGGDLAARNLSSLESFGIICSHISDNRYSCLLSCLLFISEGYSFQVAAKNRHGVGPFSVPVLATIDCVQGRLLRLS